MRAVLRALRTAVTDPDVWAAFGCLVAFTAYVLLVLVLPW